jgi:glycosyltransferase involved in cell wall biosynthesis
MRYRAEQIMSPTSGGSAPLLSVVLPVYNERENLPDLIGRTRPILEKLAANDFEMIFVDDGSTDGSSEMLDLLSASDPRYQVVHLSRNFGHQAALQAGLDDAHGDAVVLMDADLQDPPELLIDFVEKWREGYEVVYAIRHKRKEVLWKRFAYAAFYRTMRVVSNIDVPLDSGDFCLLDRQVVLAMAALPERNRFVRGLRKWVGFRQVGIAYDRAPRNAGQTKYSLRKLVGLAMNGYIGFSALPLRIAAWLGMLAAACGFVLTVYVIVTRLLNPTLLQGWASTSALILFIGGVQLIVLGIMGEYLGRVYDEVRQRPLYVVSSRTRFTDSRVTDSRAPHHVPCDGESSL